MNICITNWYGRLGNNIIQVKHALLLAIYYKFNVILPKHPYFNTQYIIINRDIYKHDIKVTDKKTEFFCLIDEILMSYYQPIFDINLDKAYTLLKKIFIINLTIIKPLPINDVVIHIRGGDIFSSNPHPGYISPPLSFYTANLNAFDKIIIISEDTLNPCVNALLKYPNITYKKNTLTEDILLLLQSPNVIFSVGTFVTSLLLLSTHIKNVYATNEINNTLDNCSHIKIHKTDLTHYFKLMGPWKNTKEQRRLLLNYNKPLRI